MDPERIFILVSFLLLFSLPIILSLVIVIWSQTNIFLAFFVLMIEIALVLGIISKIDNYLMSIGMVVMGVFIGVMENITFSRNFGLEKSIVSFFIYQWLWLSMYQSGLQISLKKIEVSSLLNALTITLGSVATLLWFWSGFVF